MSMVVWSLKEVRHWEEGDVRIPEPILDSKGKEDHSYTEVLE